jgi:hypothetical protein
MALISYARAHNTQAHYFLNTINRFKLRVLLIFFAVLKYKFYILNSQFLSKNNISSVIMWPIFKPTINRLFLSIWASAFLCKF